MSVAIRLRQSSWLKKLSVLLVSSIAPLVILTIPSLALPFGSGTFGTCQFNTCSISISSYGLVNLDIAPQPSPGICTIENNSIAVLTDDSNGFSLTLNDNATNTALQNGSASINSVSGTLSSPTELTSDSWGYRVDGLDSFGSGPTSDEANSLVPSATPLFAAIKPSNLSADTIASTAIAADPAVTTNVFYGVCADDAVKAGEYITFVTYSAVTN